MNKGSKFKFRKALLVSFTLLLFSQHQRLSLPSAEQREPLFLAVPASLAQSSQEAQQSQTNPQQTFYEIKLLKRTHQRKLEEENVARIKELLKLDSKSFLETWRRRELDPTTFVKEAANRGSLYLACGDRYSAYRLYKEATLYLKRTDPSTDSQQIESSLWQLLLSYLKTTLREGDEREAIEKLVSASDRPGAVPYISGASTVAEYFIASGRRQSAIDLFSRLLSMILKNRPADTETLCAAGSEFERINSLNRMPRAALPIKQVEQAWAKVLEAAKQHHAKDRSNLIEPMAHLSSFYIRYDELSKGEKLAAEALKLATEEKENCILDRLYLIADAYLDCNEIETADQFLRAITKVKNAQFRRVALCYLPSSIQQLKTKYEERGQWARAQSLLELFIQAQEPGTYAEVSILQELLFCEMEEAASLNKHGKQEEAAQTLKKSDDVYLKVRHFYLANNQKANLESFSKHRKDRLKNLELENNLEF